MTIHASRSVRTCDRTRIQLRPGPDRAWHDCIWALRPVLRLEDPPSTVLDERQRELLYRARPRDYANGHCVGGAGQVRLVRVYAQRMSRTTGRVDCAKTLNALGHVLDRHGMLQDCRWLPRPR